MNLYILRHAIAEPRDKVVYSDDSQRPLSKAGRKKMVKIARGIKKMGIEPDLILSSPYLRARQTAEILIKTLDLKKKQVIYSDHLSPSGNTEALIAEINDQHQVDDLVLVGHEPDLSEIISVLVSGSSSAAIVIKKGGLCCLSMVELSCTKCAELAWVLTPAMLVAFSGSRSKLDIKSTTPKNVEEAVILQEEAESGSSSDSPHPLPVKRRRLTSSRSARPVAPEQPEVADEPYEATGSSLSSEEVEASTPSREESIPANEEEAQ